MPAEPEFIEQDRPPARHRRLALVLAAALVLLAAGGGTVHLLRVPAEREAVEACADGAVRAVERSEQRLAAVATYIAPRMGAGARLDESLLVLVEEEAAQLVGPVEEARSRCADIVLSPLSGGRREARSAYLVALDAQVDRLEQVGRDGIALFSGYGTVQELLDAARAARR